MHSGYNVYNTGSHADLGNLKTILEKKSVDLVLFYLCDMQCCMATIKTNIEKTKSQINEINNLSRDCKIPVIYGGNGINFLLDDTTNLEYTFLCILIHCIYFSSENDLNYFRRQNKA